MDLKGRVVVITGAGRGIGRAIAAAFSRRGAHLALLDVDVEQIAADARHYAEADLQAHSYRCDVSDEGAVSAAFEAISQDFGRLDVLVNNAGITRDALLLKVENDAITRRMSLEQWRKVIDVNLTGVFLCAREAAGHMVQFGNGGAIISLSSVSRCGNAGQTNYSAAKAGVAAMSVVWAKELARFGIRAASIAPGLTRTEMVAAMKPEAVEKLMSGVPLKRCAEVEEIAQAALFIAENDYFTGRCIDLDGGLRL